MIPGDSSDEPRLDVFDAWRDVQKTSEVHPGMTTLEPAGAQRVIDAVADAFVIDRSNRWWWNTLKGDHLVETLLTGDGLSTIDAIRARADVDELWNLIVTDEQPNPAGVVVGPLGHLLGVLADLPPFEFVLYDEGAGRAFFESHHDVLYVTNTVPSGSA